MTVLNNLDENLYSTWATYTDYIKKSINENQLSPAIEFSGKLDHPELAFTSCDFPLYWALLHACDNNFTKSLEIIKKAHQLGYKNFWKFYADNHGWYDKTSEDYLLLEPIHKNDSLQNYLKSTYPTKIKLWGLFDPTTPICWFEKIELKRKNEKCCISKKKLQKGEQVYGFRLFNGSHDIPTELYYARIEAFESNSEAKENLRKYTTNTYKLSDYRFNVQYKHPLINLFWHSIENFDLLTTLKLIANPPVNPTQYLKYSFEESPLSVYNNGHKEYKVEKTINYGTGGEFLNLLYVLVKCGYLKDILSLLPQLPEHFPYLFLFFNSKNIHEKIGNYLQEDINELSFLLDIALKSYNKKSPDQVLQLALYGRKHTNFLKNFSTCLNNYECHLYSNYRPGANWFFKDFNQFSYAKGGGLLDFFITEPEFIPSLKEMKSKNCYLTRLSSAIDAYDNSLPFLYRVITLNAVFEDNDAQKQWIDLPLYIKESNYYKKFKQVHNYTLKIVKLLSTKNKPY